MNLHPSLLPSYHGPFPWFWQYHDFISEWGATVHQIDEGQDTGPILKQEPVSIPLGTDITEAMKIMGAVGARLFVVVLQEIARGTLRPTPQPLHRLPKARIVERHERFIDWQSWPIERVWHFMRGTHPWSDAVDYPRIGHRSATWKIGDYERCQNEREPGVVLMDELGYFVSHHEGKIRLSSGPSAESFASKCLSRFLGS
jgi:methionyl-tRNA formyltransferase